MKKQTNTFNSVVIVSAEGKIEGVSPQSLKLLGKFLDSTGGKLALTEKKPLISEPYTSITNRLVVFISQPIFSSNGKYLGLVGGTIYLLEGNVLSELLGEHYYNDGSYVFVVNEDGRIIYHPNNNRINNMASQNSVVSELMKGHSGAMRNVNTEDISMLAGYAYIPASKWGVVSQRPTEVTLQASKELLNEMIVKTIPMLLLSLLIIFFISKRIARPLQTLANYAKASTNKGEIRKVPEIGSWYYEAIQLENALVNSFSFPRSSQLFHSPINH